ncbi:hypothetical protein P167DRAFT_270937 [Morchella conica CCBAS932]|uniref:Uncharacterized protein n=1 Tax=Morchella conica CCBAS932 TaxID=1392247 RepID=A0A3N4KLK4_9PEZI|nr:hypothetical protein P167DRAFT_270937 [Morchella conica CCBAS932]
MVTRYFFCNRLGMVGAGPFVFYVVFLFSFLISCVLGPLVTSFTMNGLFFYFIGGCEYYTLDGWMARFCFVLRTAEVAVMGRMGGHIIPTSGKWT